ncbi:MAG: hydrogenase maturation protease [Phycisphaerae bacterium]
MARLTVLGIGNMLMSDDGLGPRLLEGVSRRRDWGDGVEFIDGGAGGLNLLNVIESAERMVVFDVAEMGLPPGDYRVVKPEQLADDTPEERISMHDVPFIETLKLCGRFYHSPDTVTLLVVQPKVTDFGRQLSDELSRKLDSLLDVAEKLVADDLGRNQ